MFLHIENQQLLWHTLQKSQYLVELNKKYPGYGEVWFRGISEQFYTQWITANKSLPSNAQDLLETNKHAILFMVADIKKLLEYGNAENTWYSGISAYSSDTMRFPETRRQLGEINQQKFVKYQSEYNRFFEPPKRPLSEIRTEELDSKITNMEELVKEHLKRRDMDLTTFIPPQQPTAKLKILNELNELDELNVSAIETETEPEPEPETEPIIEQRKEDIKKVVHWSEDITQEIMNY
jgi:hypothetical protein